MKQFENREKAKPNPAGENIMSPKPMASMNRTMNRQPEVNHGIASMQIPTTKGYAGKKMTVSTKR